MDKLPIPKERNLYLAKQVNQESINSITKSIIEINDNDEHLVKLYGIHDVEYKPKPIRIYIDSYGGQVYQCMGLVGVMQKSDTPVHTIVTGAAMSAGFIITIAGHKRFAYEHSTLMYHQASSIKSGKVKDIEEKLIQTKKLQTWMEDMTVDLTKISRSRVKEVYDNKEDWYMTADEAKKVGAIDEII